MQKYNDFLKFSFFEKATKICTILLSKRQNHKEDVHIFVAFSEFSIQIKVKNLKYQNAKL